MYWDIVEARVIQPSIEPWTIALRFGDDLQGKVRFAPSFFEGIFSHLLDPAQFAQISIEHGALTWPGGLDLAPDALHDLLRTTGECELTGSRARVTA